MYEFMSKPRFQIPSLRELKQARLLKLLRENKPRSRTEWNFALAAEYRRRKRKRNRAQNRHQFQQALNKDKPDLRAEAYVFYRNILRDPNATVHEQLTARERLDKLLGLDLG